MFENTYLTKPTELMIAETGVDIKMTNEEKSVINSSINSLRKEFKKKPECFLYGSRVVCNPAPKNSDIDVALYLDNISFYDIERALGNLGFEYDCFGYEESHGGFMSYRKGSVNFVVFFKKGLFDAYETVTFAIKHLNIQDKDMRVQCYEEVNKRCS